MILYREKDLDAAYKIDCKARTRNNLPWVKREEFRTIYEDLMHIYMIQLSTAVAMLPIDRSVTICVIFEFSSFLNSSSSCTFNTFMKVHCTEHVPLCSCSSIESILSTKSIL